jgi:nicotinate phosphoribosyltransferase
LVHDTEEAAFEQFASSQPENVTLLIDTYDTLAAAHKVAELAPRLAARDIRIRAVRLDSGDLADLAKRVREILDAAGLHEIHILCSGNLDEEAIRQLLVAGAPIDSFGVGTQLDTSADAPYLDCAYKLVEYADRPRRKRSTGKATWPGRKQVWRRFGTDGCMAGDVVSLEDDPQDGEPLLTPVMRGGRRVEAAAGLDDARVHAADALTRLPDGLRSLEPARLPYPVEISPRLGRLARESDRSVRTP